MAVAIDSSNNGRYYGIIICREHVLIRIVDKLLSTIPYIHMRKDKGIRRKIALSTFRALIQKHSSEVKLLCLKVNKGKLEDELLHMFPRIPTTVRKKILQQSIATTILNIIAKEANTNTQLRIYVDNNEKNLFEQTYTATQIIVAVDKNLVVPADIIAWLNNRGEDKLLKQYIEFHNMEQEIKEKLKKYIKDVLRKERKKRRKRKT